MADDLIALFGVSGGSGGVAIGDAVGGGTPGSVLYIGPTGLLAEDNPHFFWDDANDRLGIGTATPAYRLDVAGDGHFTEFILVGSLPNPFALPALVDARKDYDGGTNVILTNSDSGVAASANFAAFSDVAGLSFGALSSAAPAYGGAPAGPLSLIYTNNAPFVLMSDDAAIIFAAGVSPAPEVARFDATTGYFGINQPAPAARLDVGGDGHFTEGLAIDGTVSPFALNIAGTFLYDLVGTSGTPTSLYIGDPVAPSAGIIYLWDAGAAAFTPISFNSNFLTLGGGIDALQSILTHDSFYAGDTANGILGKLILNGDASGYVQIQPASAAGSWTLTLPDNAGAADDVLVTDGGGVTSWKSSTALKIAQPLFDHYADAGNGTTVETDLCADTIAAGQLAADGDKLEAEYGGLFVSSATATRQVRAYFGDAAIFDTGALTLSLSSAWTVSVLIIRVSATVVRYKVELATQGAALSAYTSVGEVTGLTLSGTNVLKITGQAAGVGAATNDIVAKMGTVSYQPGA